MWKSLSEAIREGCGRSFTDDNHFRYGLPGSITLILIQQDRESINVVGWLCHRPLSKEEPVDFLMPRIRCHALESCLVFYHGNMTAEVVFVSMFVIIFERQIVGICRSCSWMEFLFWPTQYYILCEKHQSTSYLILYILVRCSQICLAVPLTLLCCEYMWKYYFNTYLFFDF